MGAHPFALGVAAKAGVTSKEASRPRDESFIAKEGERAQKFTKHQVYYIDIGKLGAVRAIIFHDERVESM